MERNPSILCACLIGAFILLSASVRISTVKGDIVEDNAEIKEAWAEVNRGHKEPEQVYECLEKIQQVYASIDMRDLSENDRRRKKNFDILFKAWKPSSDQCEEDDFMREHFARYTLSDINVGNYWLRCEQKQIKVCEPVFEANLRAKLIDRIGDVKWQQVRLLVDSVKSECPGKSLAEIEDRRELDEVLTSGMLKYMEASEGPLSKKVFKLLGSSEDRFKQVYWRLVGNLCSTVVNIDRKLVEIFDVIKKHNTSWEPTGLLQQFMEAERICKLSRVSSFESMTFKLLRETNRKKGLFGL